MDDLLSGRKRILRVISSPQGPQILIAGERRLLVLVGLVIPIGILVTLIVVSVVAGMITSSAANIIGALSIPTIVSLFVAPRARVLLGIAPESVSMRADHLVMVVNEGDGGQETEDVHVSQIEAVAYQRPDVMDRLLTLEEQGQRGASLAIPPTSSLRPERVDAMTGHASREGFACGGVCVRLKSMRVIKFGVGLDEGQTKLLLKLLEEKFGLPVQQD